MPTDYRVPPAELSGPYARTVSAVARRMFGQVPDGLRVLWHHRPVMWATFGYERKAMRFRALDPDLKSYAEMATAAAVGCSWCMDFGYYLAHNEGLDIDKLRQVPAWRDSQSFSATERAVLAYAEAMTSTPATTTPEMVSDLVERLGVRAVVELTEMVSLENKRARFNDAMGLAEQGFAASCDLPPLTPLTRPHAGS